MRKIHRCSKCGKRTNRGCYCPECQVSRRRPTYSLDFVRKAKICVYAQNKNARERSLPNTLTPEEWQHALNYFHGCCAVCGRQLDDMFGRVTASADHWIPLAYKDDDNPGSCKANIVPLCVGWGGCNNNKNAIVPDVWLERKYGKRKAKKIAARVQKYFDSLTEE